MTKGKKNTDEGDGMKPQVNISHLIMKLHVGCTQGTELKVSLEDNLNQVYLCYHYNITFSNVFQMLYFILLIDLGFFGLSNVTDFVASSTVFPVQFQVVN